MLMINTIISIGTSLILLGSSLGTNIDCINKYDDITISLLTQTQVVAIPSDKNIPATVDSVLSVDSTTLGTLKSICNSANNEINGINVLNIDSKSSILRFNNELYSNLDAESRRAFMEKALAGVSKCGLSAKNINKVYNFIADQDTAVTNAMKYLQQDANADFVSAKKYFSPFEGTIGTALGIICLAIFLLAGLSIIIDIFYISLPGFQGLLDRGDDNKHPIGVSLEAWSAVKDSESSDNYKNPLGIYLKRRVVVIIVMSICLMYLVSGKIYDLVIFFMDAFNI